MRKRKGYNPKRKIRDFIDCSDIERLAVSVKYGGNSEHKMKPNDFGLTPPVNPRPDKTLCDIVEIFEKARAYQCLICGIRRGMVSEREEKGFPKNIWAVTDDGHPLEAQLENEVMGVYHGYPVPETDPFRDIILECWYG